MTRAKFEMAYDGSALQEHVIDVQHLAPALLALGNLVRDANTLVNGKDIKVNVLVQSNFEEKCFNISFEVVQSLYDQVVSLLEDDKIKSAKDILEWLGIVAAPGIPVLAYLRWKAGRKAAGTTKIVDSDGAGNVVVQVNGGDQITVNQNVYMLGENAGIKKAAAQLMKPLEEEGFDTIEFRPDHPTAADRLVYSKEDARQIRESCAQPGEEEKETDYDPQPVIAHLRVHAPVFDPAAPNWRFKYGEEVIYADITETTIAQDAIDRGGVMLDDLYRVRMEITEHETKKGFRKSYKVVEVLDFTPAPRQTSFFDGLKH